MKPKLWTGARFAKGKAEVAKEYMAKGKSPKEAQRIGGAVMAAAGRAKYGKARFQKLAEHWKKTSFAGHE